MKVSHLKIKKSEREAIQGRFHHVTAVGESDEREYPSGMEIHADHHALKKLGFEEMPEHGSEHRIEGRMRVEHTSEESGEDGKPKRRVRFQITHMGSEPYGGGEKESTIREEIEKAAGRDKRPRHGDAGGSEHDKEEEEISGA